MTRKYLPALRGRLGDWAYYSCLMPLGQLAARVGFVQDIHKSAALSDLIQRELKEGRSTEIARYLVTTEERFFNSLVIAVYGGDPAWHQLSDLRAATTGADFEVDAVDEDVIASIGFLSFTGREKLFALDGQHRLAGVKKAIAINAKLAEEEVSVIFVAHKTTRAGRIRTRRLFTTLNKTARPVSKGEIIALDESDIMAIVARFLVENDSRFSDHRILVSKQVNLPPTDSKHLTTIANLYDLLTVLFSKIMHTRSTAELKFYRPPDPEIENYQAYAQRYFDLLGNAFPELGEFYRSKKPDSVVRKHRHAQGGSVLFRPVGLSIFVELTASLVKRLSLEAAVERLALLPTDLTAAPYYELLWDPVTGNINTKRKVLLRRVLEYMLGLTQGRRQVDKLRQDLLDRVPDNADLPDQVG